MQRDRRAFLESLAVAPLVPAAFSPQAVPAAAPLGHEILADALAEAVKKEFGASLDEGDLQAIRKKLLGNLERAERLRKTARLENADEPVGRFEAAAPARKGARR